jgi:rRNA maturation RNase YbeY
VLNVFFHYSDRQLTVKNKVKIRAFIQDIFINEEVNMKRIDYVFCSDEFLLNINKSFLNHDTFTDIVTFDLSDHPNEIIGEIYISIDRVKENATMHNCNFKTEILRVLFHGSLHLCGYKDKAKKDVIEMRAKENFYISTYELGL